LRGIGKCCLVALTAVVVAVCVAACGGGSSSSSSATTSTGSPAATGGAGTTAAKKVVAPYIGQPSPFPVTEKLKEIPQGAKYVYVDLGTPASAVFWLFLQEAAKTMGVQIERVKAGTAANTTSAAFDTVVAMKPDGVIVPAISIQLWSKQLKELQDAGIPVVTSAVAEAEKYGIESPQSAEPYAELVGRLMAAYIPAEMNPEANVVFYGIPEFPLSPVIEEAFSNELESVCPGCSVRTADIPVASIASTAPNLVVSDLQANPDTDVAVFSSDSAEAGLPAALKAAGIEIETIGDLPVPENLQYLKEGKETAALAYDVPVASWALLDQVVRESIGQKLSGPEAEGIPVLQFLRQEDITFDPTKGWTGYPEYAERFAELWGVAGK
jgi:ribose transport system substrate-binding protein